MTGAFSRGILRSGTTFLQAGWSAKNGERSCGRPSMLSPADAVKCSCCATSKNSAHKKPRKYSGSLHRRSRHGYIELVFNCERNSAWSVPFDHRDRGRARLCGIGTADMSGEEQNVTRRCARRIEYALLACGLMLLAFSGVTRLQGFLSSRAAIRRLETSTPPPTSTPGNPLGAQKGSGLSLGVDFSRWGENRVQAYRECSPRTSLRHL